jgi:hypothetical protein
MNKRETLTGENRAPIADNQNSITAGINQSCWPPESHADIAAFAVAKVTRSDLARY